MNLIPSNLFERELRNLSSPQTYLRGEAYFEMGRVRLVARSERAIEFTVVGSAPYTVMVTLNGHKTHFTCDCPHSREGAFCKHMVASGLYIQRRLSQENESRWKEPLDRILKSGEGERKSGAGRPYFLGFSLLEQFGAWLLLPYTLDMSRVLELNGSAGDGESGQSIVDLISQNAWLGAQARRVQQDLDPSGCVNCPAHIVSVANVIRRSEGQAGNFYYYGYTRPIEDYLALLAGTGAPVFIGDQQTPLRTPVQLWDDDGELTITVSKDEDGSIHLSTRVDLPGKSFVLRQGDVRKIAARPLWVGTNGDVFRVPGARNTPGLSVFIEQPEVRIPREMETEFLERYLVPIANLLPIEGDTLAWEDIRAKPVKRLYLGEMDGELIVRLMFSYDGIEVPYQAGAAPMATRHKQDGTWTLLRIHRELSHEEEIFRSISGARSGLKYQRAAREENGFSLRSGVDVVDFLLKKLPVLLESGFEVYGEENLVSARVNRNQPTLSLNVSSGIDWFDLTARVLFGDTEASLLEVRRALRKKKRYVKLADGTIGEIPDAWVRKYRHFFGLGEQTESGARLSKHHVALVEELMSEADHASADVDIRRRLGGLRDFSGIAAAEVPEGFCGELRPYQKAGYDWLHFLRQYGFGGCLADDMGLGKTVQVLVFLLSLHGQGQQEHASLVVLPRSLLFNWQRESDQFTPGLRILEHFGPGRAKTTRGFKNYDIILTTYGTMRRDIQMFKGYQFHYAVLDESQAIKNPLAQVSKAARMLNADRRLVMTGTPVENSTFELWSQFAFLNPGLLGGLEYFKREFANPIERYQDEDAAAMLRKLVHPFILRRTKQQVAPELPPRSERIVYGEMEPAQRRLYERTRDEYRDLVMGLIESRGLEDTRMKILEGLLRLRQISNHPRLVDADFRGKAAKMDLLLEHLETLRAEGHKALVFSQFVQMLRLIRDELDQRGIPYAYLDGRTQDRQSQVDRFQTDELLPFFLISLRAGGVGLNLTSADYVIHVDPWWNPAVEMQAADRTHRIGQDKPVFVYKLITRDTVEEKILTLQARKKALVDQLITTEGGFFKDLDAREIRELFT